MVQPRRTESSVFRRKIDLQRTLCSGLLAPQQPFSTVRYPRCYPIPVSRNLLGNTPGSHDLRSLAS